MPRVFLSVLLYLVSALDKLLLAQDLGHMSALSSALLHGKFMPFSHVAGLLLGQHQVHQFLSIVAPHHCKI